MYALVYKWCAQYVCALVCLVRWYAWCVQYIYVLVYTWCVQCMRLMVCILCAMVQDRRHSTGPFKRSGSRQRFSPRSLSPPLPHPSPTPLSLTVSLSLSLAPAFLRAFSLSLVLFLSHTLALTFSYLPQSLFHSNQFQLRAMLPQNNTYTCQKRDQYTSKKINTYQKRPTEETY